MLVDFVLILCVCVVCRCFLKVCWWWNCPVDSTFPPQNILATSCTLRLCRVTFYWFLPALCTIFLYILRSFALISPPASPPRSVVLDCHHVSLIDYSVINELRDLLRQFKLREVRLVFSRLQVRPSTITVSQTFIADYWLLNFCLWGFNILFFSSLMGDLQHMRWYDETLM